MISEYVTPPKGAAFSIQQTYSGSTLINIFDNQPKVTRPQMPLSFVTNNMTSTSISGLDPFMGNYNSQMPTTGGRKDFRFYTVRASRVGNPISITIEPPGPAADGTPALISSSPTYDVPPPIDFPPYREYQMNGYAPFPPKSPQEVYRPVSYTDSRLAQDDRKFFSGDQGSESDGSSSSSEDSEDGERKRIFHYLEFALVSVLVNPVFGAVAVILSLSSKYKAKKRLYGEARVEARFALVVAGLGIGITVLTVVLVVLYLRTGLLCDNC